MTEPFRPDDELVSAVLDGEATADERARVAADPTLRARLEELRAVSDLVAEPLEPQAEVDKERALAAAEVAVHRTAPSRVVPLRRRRSEVPRGLAVAAALLFAIIGLGFVASQVDTGDDGGSDDALSSADSGDEAGTDGAEGAELEESADSAPAEDAGGALSGEEAEGRAELAAVANEAQLYAALRQSDVFVERAGEVADDSAGDFSTVPSLPQATLDATTLGDSEDCEIGLNEVDPALAGLLLRATTTYAGTPAVVYVYGTTTGGQRVIVVSEDGCRTLAAFDL